MKEICLVHQVKFCFFSFRSHRDYCAHEMCTIYCCLLSCFLFFFHIKYYTFMCCSVVDYHCCQRHVFLVSLR